MPDSPVKLEPKNPVESTFGAAAYGGPGWRPRRRTHGEEIGDLWAACGQDSEWAPLKAVLLHRPGRELTASADPEAAQMLAPLDLERAHVQHDAIAAAYRAAGVAVHDLEPAGTPTPNQMFCADLVFMTAEGAIMARPASEVRAGEERQVTRRLADLGIPILRTLQGTAVFEGADALWLDSRSVVVGRGLRTNSAAIAQIAETLGHMGVEALRDRGYAVQFLPDEAEASRNRALIFVTLGPRKILMVAGNPMIQAFYQDLGIASTAVAADELVKAAGAVGCLTAVLRRDLVGG